VDVLTTDAFVSLKRHVMALIREEALRMLDTTRAASAP
jgi:hypothetical protein